MLYSTTKMGLIQRAFLFDVNIMVGVELNPFLKTTLNVLCMHKTDLVFLNSFFLYLI